MEPKPKIVALVEWSHLIEDFLDNIGISFEDFASKMTGGWLFGYIEALKLYNVETVLFCFSARVKKPERITHVLTGAQICILPAPRMYRYVRRKLPNPYAASVEEAAGNVGGLKRLWYNLLLKSAAYASTPFFSLHKAIKTNRCSLILCQDYEHARFDVCVILGKLLRIPVFATFQGGNWQMSPWERFIRPATLKGCKGLIVASEIEVERLKKSYRFPAYKIAKICNPLDLSMWQGPEQKIARAELQIDADARVVVWHGRVDYYRKGLDVLLDAWQQITEEQPDHVYQLLLVGTGNNATLLEQRLATAKFRGVCWVNRYINDRKQIYTYLKSANIYVFPSRNEGFPVAPLEGMACGLPLIASDAPGMADILKRGEESGGILLPKGDVKALAEALQRLLQNPVLCAEMGEKAAINVRQNFSLDAVGKQLTKFIFK